MSEEKVYCRDCKYVGTTVFESYLAKCHNKETYITEIIRETTYEPEKSQIKKRDCFDVNKNNHCLYYKKSRHKRIFDFIHSIMHH